MLAVGNGVLAGYNGLLLYQRRRRHFAAGSAVILGSIALAIGMRDGANYPTADIAFGAAAVATGAAHLLIMGRQSHPHPLLRSGGYGFSVTPTALSSPVQPTRPAMSLVIRPM